MEGHYRRLREQHKKQAHARKASPSNSFKEKREAYLEETREKRRRVPSASSYQLFMSRQGHNIHKLKAKDSTGRWAYYFVYVQPTRERQFRKALDGNGTIDLESYGRVIGSCYGEEPSDSLRVTLREKYGFEV